MTVIHPEVARIKPFLVSDYVVRITGMMSDKYGYDASEALRRFMASKTWKMLDNPRLEMWEFTPDVIFEMWECEAVTGDPRNSVYLREES